MENQKKVEILANFLEQQIDSPLLKNESIWEKMGISQSTFYRLQPKAMLIVDQRIAERRSKTDIIKTQAEETALQLGLKSKLERMLEYQAEIDRLEKQLRGEIEFTFLAGSRIYNSHTGGKFKLPIQIQNQLREMIKSYRSEISRMDGDYVTKIALGGASDLPPVQTDTFIQHQVIFKKM